MTYLAIYLIRAINDYLNGIASKLDIQRPRCAPNSPRMWGMYRNLHMAL